MLVPHRNLQTMTSFHSFNAFNAALLPLILPLSILQAGTVDLAVLAKHEAVDCVCCAERRIFGWMTCLGADES